MASLGVVWILLVCSCFNPRNNPIDPNNPHAATTVSVDVDYTFDTLTGTLRFYVVNPARTVVLSTWDIDQDGNGTVDRTDSTWDSASCFLAVDSNWNRQCSVSVAVIFNDGSRGRGSTVIEKPWMYYDSSSYPVLANPVYAIAVDSSGTKWVGIKNGNLVKIEGKSSVVTPRPSPFQFVGNIRALALQKNGNPWIGAQHIDSIVITTTYDEHNNPIISRTFYTLGGGLFNNNWVPFDNAHSGLPANEVERMVIDVRDRIWCSADTYGLIGAAISQDNILLDSWTEKFGGGNYLPSNTIGALAADSSGNIWIGMRDVNELICFDGINRWTVYSDSAGLSINRINALIVAPDQSIWIGTDEGVVHFANGHVQQSYTTKNVPLGASGNFLVSALALSERGVLWAGTKGTGLLRFDGTSWEVYNKANSGLPSDFINALAVEGKKRVWIGTDKGLAKYYCIYNE